MTHNEERFAIDYTINYEGIDPDLCVKFSRIMELFQNTSTCQTEQSPYPMAWFRDNSVGFLLTNWQVNVNRQLILYERVKVRTWPSMFKGILADRYFEMLSEESDEVIACANSKWVYTDLNRRRPIKPFPELTAGYGGVFEASLPKDFSMPSPTEVVEKIFETNFTVTRRDIDSNNHVNNVKYVEWSVDTIPDDIYDSCFIVTMKAQYKHECVKGAKVLLETFKISENSFLTTVKDFGGQAQLLASIYSEWKEK